MHSKALCVETTHLCCRGTQNNPNLCVTQNIIFPLSLLVWSLIVDVHNNRLPANKHVHKIHPSCNTTSKIPVCLYFKIALYIDYHTINSTTFLQNHWNTWSLNMTTLPVPLSNDKCYKSKSSMYRTKIKWGMYK